MKKILYFILLIIACSAAIYYHIHKINYYKHLIGLWKQDYAYVDNQEKLTKAVNQNRSCYIAPVTITLNRSITLTNSFGYPDWFYPANKIIRGE